MPVASFSSAPHPLAAGWPSLTDTRLVLLVAAVLFVLAAWPLLLVPLPPFQDLPNHVATAHIVAHPDLYPQFTFNGLFKSNCLLTLWFCLLGGHGLFGAARAFTALVLGRQRARPAPVRASLRRPPRRAAWRCSSPGRWCTASASRWGFLNFTFAFALSLILLTVLDRQRERPTPAARPRDRRPLRRRLVRAPVPARRGGGAGRPARRHPPDLARTDRRRRRAAVAAGAGRAALPRLGPAAPRQGRELLGRRRHVHDISIRGRSSGPPLARCLRRVHLAGAA